MKKLLSFFFIVQFLIFNQSFLQANNKLENKIDSKPKNFLHSHYVKESIAPLSLMAGTAIILSIPNLKEGLQNSLNWNDDLKPSYKNMGDDYIRYAPTVLTYVLSDLLHDYGFQAKHRFLNRTAILAVSYITSDLIVYRTKKLTKVLRPGRALENKDYSFPSQHTAMAFVGATFLHRELGHISPWISVGGYAIAGYVGYARIARNRHWTSDVLMGAAVGILMTNASYWAYDAIMKKFSKSEQLAIAPFFDINNTAGVHLSYQF